MPEGHTIHRIAADHFKVLRGKPVAVMSPQGRFAAGAAMVDGSRLLKIEAHGKHLFYRWGNGLVGHVHLGLFGKFRVHHQPVADEAPSVRMRLSVPKATIDLTGPTECSIGTPEDRDRIVRRLGPDPLGDDADPQQAFAAIVRRAAPIAQLLLDQKVMSGVGNVYRAEALFVNGIHPGRPGRQITPTDFDGLWSTIVAMLRQGFIDNHIITVDRAELDVSSARTRRGETTYVYHRDLCLRCTNPIRTIELGGRPCYYCPTCQPQ